MKKNYIFFFLFFFCLQAATAQYVVHIAGNNSCYSPIGDGGPAFRASTNEPYGICRDNAGNIFIGETNGTEIVRKINAATGIITTVAGGGPYTAMGDNIAATSANIGSPVGLCINAEGDLLIADNLSRIRKVDMASGIITTVAGNITGGYSGDNGPATAAGLHQPVDVAVDAADNIYIADQFNQVIRKVTTVTGIITTIAGAGPPGVSGGFGGDGGSATAALLNDPRGICLDHAGNVYIADYANNRIRKVMASTGIISTVAGNGSPGLMGDGNPATAAKINSPIKLTLDKTDNIYISDYGNGLIRRVDAITGIISTYAGSGPTLSGGSIDSIGDGGPATSAVLSSIGLCFDTCGNLIFADQGCRVRAVTPALPAGPQLCGYLLTDGATSPRPSPGEQEMLSVFPNPANDELHITGAAENTTYRLLDMAGACLRQGALHSGENTVPLRYVPPGVYVLEVRPSANSGQAPGGERKMVKIIIAQ